MKGGIGESSRSITVLTRVGTGGCASGGKVLPDMFGGGTTTPLDVKSCTMGFPSGILISKNIKMSEYKI
jgi:hypothetical protein